ncbi:MAG TPA: hypothetical protein VF139_08340 [Candidatus Polarisedimenticolaceae bacterium]
MKLRSLATFVLLALAAPAVVAGEYKHSLSVYFLGAGMDGTTAVGPVEADVNVGFSDILENLEFGAMAAYRVERDRWVATADFIYMGLGATKDSSGGFLKADVDLTQTMFEVDGAYKQTDRLEWLFGLRYSSIDTEIVLTPDLGPVVEADAKADWIDPVVGARWIRPIGAKWAFVGRADVGGFGVGSDFAWQAIARFDWKVSEKLAVTFGYRALDADYEDGEGSSRFLYDVLTTGPVAGVTFSF